MNNVQTTGEKRIFLNFSNHPSAKWGEEQKTKAQEYGEITDLPFPMINPNDSSEEVEKLARKYADKILEMGKPENITVHIMGELVFTHKIILMLQKAGVKCLAATTERIVKEENDTKISIFKFVRFREF